MAITIETPPEAEEAIARAASRAGVTPEEYALRVIVESIRAEGVTLLSGQTLTAQELLRLPRAERARYLAAAAEMAAAEYEADSAKPVHERELTAFTALDGEPFLDYE